MSYKAFGAIKERMELAVIKSMTPEQINEVLCKQNEVILKAKSAYVRLTNCDQYGEDGEIHGYYCPIDILKEFDEALGVKND